MRFPVDNALSPLIAEALSTVGHDAIHVRDIGLSPADDATIFDTAASEQRTILAADTDFGFILASRNVGRPSVVLFRGESSRDPQSQIRILLLNLPQLTTALETGSIIIFDGLRIRIRPLPIR
jgi:predicted nuclease of predicted toxin-antitoxin system